MSGLEKLIGSVIVSERYQIVLPKQVRNDLGLEPGKVLVFVKEGNRVYLEKGEIVREGGKC